VAEASGLAALDEALEVCEALLIQGELDPLHTQSHTSSMTSADCV
jgi:hypothetical protein